MSVLNYETKVSLSQNYQSIPLHVDSSSLLDSQMANYHIQKQAEQQLITTDNT